MPKDKDLGAAAPPPPNTSIFTANYDSLIESAVNLNASSGNSVIITPHHASARIGGIATIRAEAYVIHGDPLQAKPVSTLEPGLPINAERILAWITSVDRLDFVLDTWEVNYRKRVERDGKPGAMAWLCWQLVRTLTESIIQLSPRVAGIVYLLRQLFK